MNLLKKTVLFLVLLNAACGSQDPSGTKDGIQIKNEEKTGNGGGSWVCREKNGDLRWTKFVDLFEAESEFGLVMAQHQGAYTEIVDQMKERLQNSSPELSKGVSDYLEQLNYLINYLRDGPPKIQYTKDTLEIINDSLYRLKPSVSQCVGGLLITDPKGGGEMIPYEQVVNYKNDGRVLVQLDLWTKLSENEKAALVFHEAIYAYRREIVGDKNSVKSREIVGLLFSNLPMVNLKQALIDIGALRGVTKN